MSEDLQHGSTVNALQSVAQKYNTTIVAGIAEKFGDSYFSSIENSMYVATCNRLGEENVGRVNASYCGGSWLIDPKGCVVGSADGQEMVLTLEIANDLVKQKKIIGVDLAEELSTISSRLNQG